MNPFIFLKADFLIPWGRWRAIQMTVTSWGQNSATHIVRGSTLIWSIRIIFCTSLLFTMTCITVVLSWGLCCCRRPRMTSRSHCGRIWISRQILVTITAIVMRISAQWRRGCWSFFRPRRSPTDFWGRSFVVACIGTRTRSCSGFV